MIGPNDVIVTREHTPGSAARHSRSSPTRSSATSCVRCVWGYRDTKFVAGFDDVFCADGAKIIQTPVQAPNANAYSERWVRNVREDCPGLAAAFWESSSLRLLDRVVPLRDG